jgi:F-type H+-transporting ATPase subunit epsilon
VADRLTLEIATPSRLVVSETVDEVVAPGSEGSFGVLPGHAPFLTTLGIGELTYRIGRDEYHVAVAGGFAEVRNDKVIILVDTAERPDEIDRARADRARQRAEQRLAGRAIGGEEIDYTRALTALTRALTRLLVAGRGR